MNLLALFYNKNLENTKLLVSIFIRGGQYD